MPTASDAIRAWIARTSGRLPDADQGRLLLASVAVGAVGGLAAVAFELAMGAVGRVALGTEQPSVGVPGGWRPVVGVALAGLACGVVARWGAGGKPAGIADVIEAARIGGDRLGLRRAAGSAGAALLAIGGGQSVGREGPIVMLAGAVARAACARVGLPDGVARTLTAAGAAAGIAASFNSPLGGAFFALEVLLGTFAADAFAPVVVASVTGTVVGHLLLGDRLALRLPRSELAGASELLLFPVLGLACALVAIALRSLVRRGGAALDALGWPAEVRPLPAVALAALAVGVGLPEVMGNGYAWMERTLGGARVGPGLLAAILGFKLVATALSYAGRGGGGIFAPSLFLGAVTGALGWHVAHGLAPSVTPSPALFETAGMGAVAAAIAQSPVTMALMTAEMTGNYSLILPLLLTIATTMVVSRAADPRSLYVQALLDRGVDPDRPSPMAVALPADADTDALSAALLAGHDAVEVVDPAGHPLGRVTLGDLTRALLRGERPRAGDLLKPPA